MTTFNPHWRVSLVVCTFAASLIACGPEDDNDEESDLATRVDCNPSSADDIELLVDSGDGNQPNDRDLVMRGRVRQSGGLTIRGVVVQGFAAEKDGFNYSVWSATVPNAVLLSKADDTGHVSVSVQASDACNHTKEAAVEVDLVDPGED